MLIVLYALGLTVPREDKNRADTFMTGSDY